MTRNFQQVDDPDRHFIRRMMAFKPMSAPEHIAALFAFVASDECPGVHGAILSADGGLTTG